MFHIGKNKEKDEVNPAGKDAEETVSSTSSDESKNSEEKECPPAETAEPVKKEPKAPDEQVIRIKSSDYQKLVREVAENKDKYLRVYAEFENARKRMERERVDFVKYANEGVLTEFLGVVDNLERSIEAAKVNHQDYKAFLKGIEMVMIQINDMLTKNNIKGIESVGKHFDPHCHEVLTQEETDQVEDGVVMEEYQKGYYLGDRVIRTAKVKVAKKKPNLPPGDFQEDGEKSKEA
ncbi:MAG: nucleotide exchange factor GrpE [Candidatus Omnitrophota bacterium]